MHTNAESLRLAYPPVRDLALSIHQRYSDQNFSPYKFADIAEVSLQELSLHDEFTADKISRWIMSSQYPQQFNHVNGVGQFGQPPITLFRSDTFLIETYFWMDSDTDIHDHSFCGAFKVLSGETSHTTYNFEPRLNYNSNLLLGQLTAIGTELLHRTDQVVKILHGNNLIHSTVHLANPTVTLCARILTFPNIRQYGYSEAGIALSGGMSDRVKRSYLLALTHYKDRRSHYEEIIRIVCDQAEPLDLYYLVVLLYNHTNCIESTYFILDQIGKKYKELRHHLSLLLKK